MLLRQGIVRTYVLKETHSGLHIFPLHQNSAPEYSFSDAPHGTWIKHCNPSSMSMHASPSPSPGISPLIHPTTRPHAQAPPLKHLTAHPSHNWGCPPPTTHPPRCPAHELCACHEGCSHRGRSVITSIISSSGRNKISRKAAPGHHLHRRSAPAAVNGGPHYRVQQKH